MKKHYYEDHIKEVICKFTQNFVYNDLTMNNYCDIDCKVSKLKQKETCMKKVYMIFSVVAIMSITVLTMNVCSGNTGSKVLNSADALKEYLDKQPANSPDKPLKVTMNVNDLMIKNISEVIKSAGKFINLDLSRSNGLTTIERSAFSNNKALISIVIPDSVNDIGVLAFRDCSNLSSIVIPDSVNNIGELAFSGCSNLSSIVIPDSVSNIGSRAFLGCSNLTSFKWLKKVSNSLINGTWIDSRGGWEFRFANENYEFLYYGETRSKGYYFFIENVIYFITISGENWDIQSNFAINGNTLRWGNVTYIKQ